VISLKNHSGSKASLAVVLQFLPMMWHISKIAIITKFFYMQTRLALKNNYWNVTEYYSDKSKLVDQK